MEHINIFDLCDWTTEFKRKIYETAKIKTNCQIYLCDTKLFSNEYFWKFKIKLF